MHFIFPSIKILQTSLSCCIPFQPANSTKSTVSLACNTVK